MSDSRVTGPNMEAIRQAARERMIAEQRRLAERQAAQAAEGQASADGATRAAEAAREAPIEEDLFVREAEVAGSTEEQRQAIYDRVNTDGEDGLSDGEFEHAFAAATIEGAQIAGDRPQPAGSADRAVEQIEAARENDRATLEQAQAAFESLPEEARAQYEGQVQALEEAYDQKWTVPDEAMRTIGEATIDPELPPPGDLPPEEYEAAVLAQAEADQATIDQARQALENVPEHLRDSHADVVGELEQQFEQKWQTPPAETLPATEGTEGGEGPPETYTVAQGDSLSAIAQEMTGDPSRWQELYEANAEVVGGDPNLIHPGQELRIPESWRPQEATVPEAPEGLETANAAIDEAERRVGEPRHTEAMYAGAPAQQREHEGQLLQTAQEAVDQLPEGADREAAQTRLDGVRQTYETKHGLAPEGGGAGGVDQALDEAERLVSEPPYSEAMFAGAPAQQREGEATAIDAARQAVEQMPEGADREAAQARLDGIRTAHEQKHGLNAPREAQREDTAEDLTRADAAEPGSEEWTSAMRDALKGVDEGNLDEANRHDLHAIADRYAQAGDPASQARAEVLRAVADNPDFEPEAAKKLIHSMQDDDHTTNDLAEVRDIVLERGNPDEMRAYALANAVANPDDPNEQSYSTSVLAAAAAPTAEVRRALAQGLLNHDDTGSEYARAMEAARTPEDFQALAIFAADKEARVEGALPTNSAAKAQALAMEYQALGLNDAANNELRQALVDSATDTENTTADLTRAYQAAATPEQRAAVMRLAEAYGNADAVEALRALETPAGV